MEPGTLTNVAGEPLSAEGRRLLDYLRSRGRGLPLPQLRERVRAAMRELDAALEGLDETRARRQPLAGEWSVAQVVDHVAQTQIRAADELRRLLLGERPPAPPVYEALTSGAAAWVPWGELLDGLRSANAELDRHLAAVTAVTESATATARSILVANRTLPDGRIVPEIFVADLGWREYALVQRLHLLDHRNQVRALRAALDR
jgi:hypothetical protein